MLSMVLVFLYVVFIFVVKFNISKPNILTILVIWTNVYVYRYDIALGMGFLISKYINIYEGNGII